MTREIRLYVEGGGNQKDTKGRLRTAFGTFFKEIKDRARSDRTPWTITVCGGRSATFDNFRLAMRSHPDAFNVLLVDFVPTKSAGRRRLASDYLRYSFTHS